MTRSNLFNLATAISRTTHPDSAEQEMAAIRVKIYAAKVQEEGEPCYFCEVTGTAKETYDIDGGDRLLCRVCGSLYEFEMDIPPRGYSACEDHEER